MKIFGVILTILLSTNVVFGQYSIEGLSLSDSTSKWFDQQIGPKNNELITGVDGSYVLVSKKTHPFFGSKNWKEGTIKYRGEIFDDYLIKYDLVNDAVIVNHPTDIRPVKINHDQIEWFIMENHFFEKIDNKPPGIPTNFYEIAYKGKRLNIVIKRFKTRKFSNGETIDFSIDRYFVYTNGIYSGVSSGKSIASLFKEHKKTIKVYLKDHGIKALQKASQAQLNNLGVYIDKLIKTK